MLLSCAALLQVEFTAGADLSQDRSALFLLGEYEFVIYATEM